MKDLKSQDSAYMKIVDRYARYIESPVLRLKFLNSVLKTPQPDTIWMRLPFVGSLPERAKLIIELDGGQHGFDENLAADAARTAYLQSESFRVMRYWNMELIQNLDGVIEGICRELGVQ